MPRPSDTPAASPLISAVPLTASAAADLSRDAAEEIAASLAPLIEAITAGLAPRLDEAVAEAILGQIDSATLRAAVANATSEMVERAALVEALESSSYRAVVYMIANAHHGFVTTSMARAAGVPPVEVRKLAARGGMTNVARSLYRVDGIDGGDRAPYAEAVLRVGDDAHLVGDSVLAFHDLALVNPRYITVGTARRVRRNLPPHIRLVHSQADPDELTEYDGVRSVTVEQAIRDSIGSVMPERLAEAARTAANEGLVRRRVADALLAEIGETR